MRLTDEQIYRMWKDEMGKLSFGRDWAPAVVATVRRCLALAALPDEQKPYEDVEFARICDSLPEGVNWGDPLTPAMARHIFESAIPTGHVMVPVGEVEALRSLLSELRAWFSTGTIIGKAHIAKIDAALAARPGEKP